MSSTTDVLVEKARSGDAEAFGELYEMYAGEMYRFAFYYLGSDFRAQDAVSEAVMRAFKSIGKLRESDKFKSWLFKILFVCCKDEQKDKSRDKLKVQLLQAYDIEDDTAPYIESFALKAALSELSAQERQIISLHFACGFKSDESACMLSMKSSTVRSKLARSVQKLRRTLGEQ